MRDILKIFFSARRWSLLSLFFWWITPTLLLAQVPTARLPAFESFFSSSALGKVETFESPHFRVQWVHPQDGVLAGPLLAYLEAARESLKPAFGSVLSANEKAPVEIFPDLESFSKVSGLSLARFRATGTIALTLDQRLMILSPRNLFKGYSWAETTVHEYIHYLIRRISPEHIPIWLHEGTAQLYQGYPYDLSVQLDPAQWGLFKKRRAADTLLDWKTLQEPFPYRETPEEAELAYIQALLFTRWLDQQCGVISLITWAGQFGSVDRALQRCSKLSESQLEAQFRPQIMKSIIVPEGRDVEFYARDFSSDSPIDKEGAKLDREARNLAQLSTELFKQGRFRPSAIQMAKALKKSEVAPPSWQHQMAQALMRTGKLLEAKSVLQKVIEDYPTEAGAWYLLGVQQYEKSQFESAWQLFLRAFFVNPFLDGLYDKMAIIRDRIPEKTKDYRLLKPNF